MPTSVAYHNYTHKQNDNSTTLSMTHSIPSSLNYKLLLLFLQLWHYNQTVGTVSNVTDNGNGMIYRDVYYSRYVRQYLYYSLAPQDGNHTIAVTATAPIYEMNAVAITLSGVNQTTPFGATAKDSTPNASLSIDIPPTATIFRIASAAAPAWYGTLTAGSGQTRIVAWGHNGGAYRYSLAASYKIGGTSTLTETGGNDKQIMGVPVNPASAPFIGMNIDQISVKQSNVNQKLFLTDNGAQTNNQLLVGEETTIDKNYISFPRLTTIERDTLSSPTTGTVLWNITTARLEVYNGSGWVAV